MNKKQISNFKPKGKSRLKKEIAERLHLWLGSIIETVVAIPEVTGLLLVFQKEILFDELRFDQYAGKQLETSKYHEKTPGKKLIAMKYDYTRGRYFRLARQNFSFLDQFHHRSGRAYNGFYNLTKT